MLSRRRVYLFTKFAFFLSSLTFSQSLQRPLSRDPGSFTAKDAGAKTPIVVTTWAVYGFQDACTAALGVLNRTNSGYSGVLDAVETGTRRPARGGAGGIASYCIDHEQGVILTIESMLNGVVMLNPDSDPPFRRAPL